MLRLIVTLQFLLQNILAKLKNRFKSVDTGEINYIDATFEKDTASN